MSVTGICNRALSAVGTRSTISDITENSPEANACLLHYQSTVDGLLRMANWAFAKKTVLATLLKSAPGTPENPTGATATWTTAYPAPPWLFQYAYPSDCLRVQRVVPQMPNGYGGVVPLFAVTTGTPLSAIGQGPAARFAIGNDLDGSGAQRTVILCNQDQAIIEYTVRIDNPELFDSLFENTLAAGLAANIGFSLTGDKGLSDRLVKAANDMVMTARAADGNEGLTVLDYQPDWMRVRGGWPIGYDTGGPGYLIQPYGPLFGAFG